MHNLTSLTHLARPTDPKNDDDESSEGADAGDDSGRRKKFLSTAFWAPALVTNAEGVVEVSFPAPDNLTAFRLMATAADIGERFGSGDTRLTVAKPLLMTPALPRFLTLGDEASLGVVVHNHTGAAGAIAVSMSAQGMTLSGIKQRQLAVPHNGSSLATFTVKATQLGTAKLIFHANLGKEEDTVEYPLPVLLPTTQELLPLGEGEALPGVPTALKLVIPAGAQSGLGGLELALDASGGLSQLGESLRYLIEYPYGCLEQTTSKVIPMLALEGLATSLEIAEVQGPKLREFIQAGVAKILAHQHSDGFSLWLNSGDREPFLTAYALYGLNLAERAGYAVPKQAMDRGIESLNSDLTRIDSGHSDLGRLGALAFALDVLAELGKPNVGAMAKLYELRADLPLFGRALLAHAMRRGGGAPAAIQTLRQEVMAAAHLVNGETAAARIIDPRQEELWQYMSTNIRTTAMALRMLLAIDAADPLVPQLVQGLLSARSDGHFYNTQENVFALATLADYAKRRMARKPSRVVVALDSRERPLLDLRVSGDTPLLRGLRLPMAELRPGALTITTYGAPVHFSAGIRYVRPLTQRSARSDGFALERRYEDPLLHTVRNELHTGETVRVVLRVRTDVSRYHIALVDHLPAGLEPVNPRLLGEERQDDQENFYWNALELHDDRVATFANFLSAHWGRGEFSYLARATTAGTFVIPAATVEEMYNPKHRATTDSAQLKILPR